jgi:hypothetical protein
LLGFNTSKLREKTPALKREHPALKKQQNSGTFFLFLWIIFSSVADPGCLSRIPDPDFYPSRIPDPKTATKERGEKKLVVIPFHVATNFTKM